MRRFSSGLSLAGLGVLALIGCRETDTAHPDAWAYDTHSNDARAKYDVVFPAASVIRLDLKISAADWQAMLDDMTDMLGDFGAGGPTVPGPGSGPGPIGS